MLTVLNSGMAEVSPDPSRFEFTSGRRVEAIMFPMDPTVPIMCPAWVTDGIRWGGCSTFIPIWMTLREICPSLSMEHRDTAESLEARIRSAADGVFGTTSVLR